MGLEVIAAGMGRTGTSSLQRALDRLGYPCYDGKDIPHRPGHVERWLQAVEGRPVDWDDLFAGYRAVADWPPAMFWRELVAHYPRSKVVLGVRDPDRWYDSYDSTVRPMVEAGVESADPGFRAVTRAAKAQVFDGLFGGRFHDRAHAIRVYEERNAQIRAEVPAARLLVLDASDGWVPLCEFLGVPVPDEPYPHANERNEFWRPILRAEWRGST